MTKRPCLQKATLVGLLTLTLALPAFAQDIGVLEMRDSVKGAEKHYSPYVGRNIPDRVLWGDTHLHTSFSADAGLTGTTLGPEEAFRLARGEVVTSTGGLKAQLRRPHDFLVVSDHAEYLGLANMLRDGDPVLLADPNGKRWYAGFRTGGQAAIDAALPSSGRYGFHVRNACPGRPPPAGSSSAPACAGTGCAVCKAHNPVAPPGTLWPRSR
jgi:hypothetical protein